LLGSAGFAIDLLIAFGCLCLDWYSVGFGVLVKPGLTCHWLGFYIGLGAGLVFGRDFVVVQFGFSPRRGNDATREWPNCLDVLDVLDSLR